jgi:hypothetical protein
MYQSWKNRCWSTKNDARRLLAAATTDFKALSANNPMERASRGALCGISCVRIIGAVQSNKATGYNRGMGVPFAVVRRLITTEVMTTIEPSIGPARLCRPCRGSTATRSAPGPRSLGLAPKKNAFRSALQLSGARSRRNPRAGTPPTTSASTATNPISSR